MEYSLDHDVSLIRKSCERSTLPDQFGRSQLLQWKNNLTGLSRAYNLFFIASIDKILVFEPHFPTQELGSSNLKIKLPVSSPGLPGHHSIDHPHAINQILVGELGDFEIVVAACDDGDVVAYYVKDIQYAIDAGASKIRRDGQWDSRNDRLRPILHENVRKSAWGLAIHREARMLAVSANTKEITIYSFALTGGDAHSSLEGGEGDSIFNDIRETTNGPVFLYDRRSNRRMTLRTDSVASNIPNISFCNTPEDPHGRFLASTNIVGVTIIWDLEHSCTVEEVVLRTRSPRATFEQWNLRMSEKHGGWNIRFLDKRSFRTTDSGDRTPTNLFWDVHPGDSRLASWVGNSDDDFEGTEVSGSEEDEEEIDIQLDDNEVLPGSVEPHSNLIQQLLPTTVSSTHSGLFIKDRSGYLESINDRSQFWMSVLTDCRAGERSTLPSCPILHTSIRDVFMLQPECDTSGRTRPVPKEDAESAPNVVDSPSKVMANRLAPGLGPILSFDFSSELPQPFCPIQVLHNPLKESLPFSSLITQCERLNMVDEIAELGVVVIGCGKGKVAIVQLIKHSIPLPTSTGTGHPCSESKRRKRQRTSRGSPTIDPGIPFGGRELESTEKPRPDGHSGKVHRRGGQDQYVPNWVTLPSRNNEIYTFKLAHKLPLPEQELSGERPRLPLVGIAVGPVQGSKRRWRILLTYSDGTILSYEVCRAKDKGHDATGVQEIFV